MIPSNLTSIKELSEEKIVLLIHEHWLYREKKLCEFFLKVLKLGEKSEKEVVSILRMDYYNYPIFIAGIPLIKSEEKIFYALSIYKSRFLRGYDTISNKQRAQVHIAGIQALKLNSRSKNEIMDLMKKILAMKNTGDIYLFVKKRCFDALQLEKISDMEILDFMEEHDYYHEICDECIKLLKLEDKSLEDLDRILDKSVYRLRICKAIDKVTDSEERKKEIWKKHFDTKPMRKANNLALKPRSKSTK